MVRGLQECDLATHSKSAVMLRTRLRQDDRHVLETHHAYLKDNFKTTFLEAWGLGLVPSREKKHTVSDTKQVHIEALPGGRAGQAGATGSQSLPTTFIHTGPSDSLLAKDSRPLPTF